MRHLFTTALMTAAFALPLSAAAQERYPALNADQLNPEQKAYVENLQKPPRSNTTALKNPPYKVYMRSPELAAKLEAVSDYVRWGTGQPPRLTELAIMLTARQWSSDWILARPLPGGGARRSRSERRRRHRGRQATGKNAGGRDHPLQLRDGDVSRQGGVGRHLCGGREGNSARRA